MTTLHFWFDVVCPWAFFASTRVSVVADAVGARIVHHPILLGGVFRAIGAPDVPVDAMSPARARVTVADVLRHGERLGLPVRYRPDHPRRSVAAMRLVTAAPAAQRPAVADALWRAYWLEQRDLADRAVIDAVAARFGVDPARIDAADVKQALYDETARAVAAGVFGVPTFRVGDDGPLRWGFDRMAFVAADLGAPASVAALPPAVTGPPARRLEFFHDFASPFSYLAASGLDALVAGRGLELVWRPILLGGLFRDIGTPDVPLFAMNEPKRRWTTRDLYDWAARRGVPFRFPEPFPLRTVLPLRVAVAEPGATAAIYRAAWGEGRDVGDADVLRGVLTDAGFDAAELLDRATRDDVKRALRDNGDRARAAGACGVPTFLVDDEILLWGQDRMGLLADVLDGWKPSTR